MPAFNVIYGMKKLICSARPSGEQQKRISELSEKCHLLPETVAILFDRGIDDEDKINAFIHPSESRFISPFKMSGMREAVDLITRARDGQWTVVVYGDYDADGVCATTIMLNCLNDFGVRAIPYIPERKEGYGMNIAALDVIFDEFCPELIITVDCGISCAEEVEYAKEQGAEVLVTDHHELPSVLPDCVCINPKINDGYIYDNLCGAGVALKVGVALLGERALQYIDFAAIATVADSVPLTGENRDIVYAGLKKINASPRPNYAQFISRTETVTSQTISFSVAPKINAAGRMNDAFAALKLFTTDDENQIFDLSAKLAAYNTERQKCCDELYLNAKRKLAEKGAFGKVIMLWDEGWNTGFVGIVAARLADEYCRPTLLFVKHGESLKGSARSVENVNIFEALKACEEYILEYGGHSQAAGVSVSEENFSKLEDALNAYLSRQYSPEDFLPSLVVSQGAADKVRFARELDLFEPCGVGNKRPLFQVAGDEAETRPKADSPHAFFKCDGFDMVYFGGARYLPLISSRVHKKYVYEYSVSKFRGREYIKGVVRDIILDPEAGESAFDEIAVNSLINLSYGQINCVKKDISADELNKLALGGEGYGTVFIASEFASIKNSGLNLPVEVFNFASRNLADEIALSPLRDIDLSGYKRIIYLDDPLDISLPALEGREVEVYGKNCGYNFLKYVDCDRASLLKLYSEISSDIFGITGNDVYSVSLGNDFGCPPVQTAFALCVFIQLGLMNFDGGRLNVNKGKKSSLFNSPFYTRIAALKKNI